MSLMFEMKISQFLLTRFNSPVKYAPKDLGINQAWLSHRFSLFENFCLPSVSSQDSKNFHWILLIDERTPNQWVIRLNDGLAKLSSKNTILPVAQFSEASIISEIKKNVVDDKAFILSTRLDNDDAIADNFLSNILKVCQNLLPDQSYIINFSNGCKVHTSGIYKHKPQALNPFLSVFSSIQNLKTSLHKPHNKMDAAGTVIRIDVSKSSLNSIMWMQVIHNKNISNRLRKESKLVAKGDIRRFSIAQNWRQLLKNISVSDHQTPQSSSLILHL
jgi:hypothetical protein